MTVYIVFQRGNPNLQRGNLNFHGVYTDYEVAQQAQVECDQKDDFYWWDITPIELTTDSFMESVLTKDSK